ncbi:hypothetical protein R3W88_030964 [Solanum pinnatisectum]|uniref:F-box associated domain-containing protein n=1 Tax=Solanum pinnatisectum TaxID=50273 RepID=A0AAV9LLA4_9SOLN|nr:hypothetical protein R3W88_030964 [Solanum pinnatisectum]
MFMKVVLNRDFVINVARKHQPRLQYSCEGVFLFSVVYSPPTCIIFNPTTQEEVMVQHKFNPGCLQFKLLYARERNFLCQYSIYSVRTQTWKKIHCPTPNLMPDIPPAIVNGAVHLLVDRDSKNPKIPPYAKGIMVLNMDKEELTNMPHPGGSCSSWKIHYSMSLLVKDESRLWTKKCKVKLVFNNQGIHHSTRLLRCYSYWGTVMYISWMIKPLHFLDGELVFYWSNKGLFMYNMDHNTLRNIEGPQGSTTYTCYPYKKSLLTIA